MASSKSLIAKDSSKKQRSEIDSLANMSLALQKEIERLDNEFWVSPEKLKEIVNRFKEELEEGLQEEGKSIPMNVTWVHSLPTGAEKGTVLTIDLGGTNIRICTVTLNGSSATQRYTLDQEQYRLPQDLKTGSADALWTYIATKLSEYVQNKGLDSKYSKEHPMPLGFTFSYPATQHRIDHGILQRWTKGFDIDDVENHDVAAQLREKMTQHDLPLELICVINDTVGAMVASAYSDPETIVGAIFGTGCNAAYMSSVPSIKKLDPEDDRLSGRHGHVTGKMAINCEYGAFDNAHRVLPRTKYDVRIDEQSPRPGQQTFEKLSAGLYLGEIFRLVLLELADAGLIFTDQKDGLDPLRKSYALDTGFLSQIEDDESDGLDTIRRLFQDTLGLRAGDEEVTVARRVAEMVAVRGSRLCACGIAAICEMEGIKSGHVAADGSVANKHPKFKKRWATALGEILDWKEDIRDDAPIIIASAEDGSGVGCAIIAATEIERRGRFVEGA